MIRSMIKKKKPKLRKLISLCKIQKQSHLLRQELKNKLQAPKQFKLAELKKRLKNSRNNLNSSKITLKKNLFIFMILGLPIVSRKFKKLTKILKN